MKKYYIRQRGSFNKPFKSLTILRGILMVTLVGTGIVMIAVKKRDNENLNAHMDSPGIDK